jgi:release factor glutamine methyltransferase
MDSEKALMRKNVLEHEPWLALFVPDDDPLLFYRAVAAWARQLLKPDGLCLVEINEALGRQTAEVFEDAGFRDVEVLQDLNSRDRFVRAIQ